MDYKIEKLNKFSDKRGELIVFLREPEIPPRYKKFGQFYFVTFKSKGIVRGNHYHKHWREWFGIVAGRLKFKLVDVKTKEEVTMILDSDHDQYTRVEIGPNVIHAFKSLSPYAALLNYANSPWKSSDDYTYKIL